MRVVVAMDSFGGTLRSDEAVAAFAAGWREVAPSTELVLTPLSDGGPGLVDALAAALDGAIRVPVAASGPTGLPVVATVVQVGPTAYVESAQACGLDLLQSAAGDVRTATTYGVGQLLVAAAGLEGVETVVVGLGGSGTNDGGAGLWAALGAGPDDALRGGGLGLRWLKALSGLPPVPTVGLVAATDVDNPLLGLYGASNVYGPQKGADHGGVMGLDIGLEQWADLVEEATDRAGLRTEPGAGAAGGLGFALLALGASRVSGVELVLGAVGLADRVDNADLVVTGEGRFDSTSMRGKVPVGVAGIAQAAGVPCVVASGQASVGVREAASAGIDEVWSVAGILGSPEAALAAGGDGVRALGRELARSWAR